MSAIGIYQQQQPPLALLSFDNCTIDRTALVILPYLNGAEARQKEATWSL